MLLLQERKMQRVRGEVDLKRRDQTRPREGRVEAGQSVRIGNHDNKRDRLGRAM